MLAEAKTALIEAKYLCSIDPTCIHFYMQLSGYDKGMYFKCSFGAKIDYSYDGYILYTKGQSQNSVNWIYNNSTWKYSLMNIYQFTLNAFIKLNCSSVSNESLVNNGSFESTTDRSNGTDRLSKEQQEKTETDLMPKKTNCKQILERQKYRSVQSI